MHMFSTPGTLSCLKVLKGAFTWTSPMVDGLEVSDRPDTGEVMRSSAFRDLPPSSGIGRPRGCDMGRMW